MSRHAEVSKIKELQKAICEPIYNPIKVSQFLFLRIFDSKDYIWNKVTVFHSLFLSTCEKRQSVKSVSIGHYVLPPAPVQDGEDYCGDLFNMYKIYIPGIFNLQNDGPAHRCNQLSEVVELMEL